MNITEPLKPATETSSFRILMVSAAAILVMPLLTRYAYLALPAEQFPGLAKQYVDFAYLTIGGIGGPSLLTTLVQGVQRTTAKIAVQQTQAKATSAAEALADTLKDKAIEQIVNAALPKVKAATKKATEK